MRHVFAALLAAGAVASASFAASGPLPGPVTLDGVGGVVPGMSVSQLALAWQLSTRSAPTLCSFLPFRVGPARGRALFVRGRLGALFFDRGVRTAHGIGIGSSLEMLRRSYGPRLRSGSGSHFYFVTRPRKPHWRIRFDTNGDGRVTQIVFGDRAWVHVVAGCP